MEFKPFKIGKYLLLERLAMGGMAEVYRAKASGAGGFEKQLAIKRILPNYSQNQEFRRMFEYEARLSSMLTHANIVQIYDFVKSGDTYLLALEYVDGKNLRQFINKIKKQNYQLPVELAVFVINEVCKGLDYAHKKRDDLTGRPLNIIHRDMSPQNVMLSYEGAVKIVDFGIAKAKDRVDETRAGVIKGKFGYMSPEQANGESTDHRTDIFSTGIILYELLTGKRLFSAENDMATLKMIQECAVLPPSRLNPRIQPELEKIALKGLSKDAGLRFQSAGDFHRQLQEFLGKYYPSLTPRELGDVLGKVFKEEIETEKRRFEQIYRQSIPFSQGAKTNDEVSDNGDSEPDMDSGEQEDVTASEYEEDTGVTNPEMDEDSLESDSRGANQKEFAADKTVPSYSIPEDAGSALGEGEDAFGMEGSSTEPKESRERTSEKSMVTEDTVISTLGDSVNWDPEEVSQRTQHDAASGNSSIFQEPPKPSSATQAPTQAATQAAARARPRPQPSGAGNPVIRSDPKEPLLTFALEESKTEEKRESTISSMNNVNAASGMFELDSVSNGPLTVEPQEKERAPERKKKAAPSASFISNEDGPAPATSNGSGRFFALLSRALVSLVIFVGAVSTFVFLYRLYLGGGVPRLVTSVLNTISPDDRAPGPRPIDKTEVPGAKSQISDVSECSMIVDSDPRGAEVLIGKVVKGTTPTTLLIECRRAVDLTLRREGYETVSENIVVRNPELKVYKTLEPIPTGTAEISVTYGANVEIPELGFSQYIQPGDLVEVPMRANRKFKVRVTNPAIGVDMTSEVSVAEKSRKMIRFQVEPK